MHRKRISALDYVMTDHQVVIQLDVDVRDEFRNRFWLQYHGKFVQVGRMHSQVLKGFVSGYFGKTSIKFVAGKIPTHHNIQHMSILVAKQEIAKHNSLVIVSFTHK